MKRTIIITSIILFFLADIFPDVSSPYLGIKGANFLKIGLSPRAEGMGSAYVSYGKSDINALYYNPAGLTGLKYLTFQFSTLDWIDNVSINYLSFAKPSEKLSGVIFSSLSFLYISPVTYYNDWGEDIGSLDFYNLALTSGYAKKFNNLHVGANIKLLYQKIADKNNLGLGFDLGTIYKLNPFSINLINNYKLIMRDFNIGVALRNVGTKAGADYLPTTLEFGYSLRIIRNLHFALTFIKPIYVVKSLINSDYKINFGLEHLFQKILFVRMGYKANYDIPNNFSMGFGIKAKFRNGIILVDYAYAAYTYLEKTHRFGITLKLKDIIFWGK